MTDTAATTISKRVSGESGLVQHVGVGGGGGDGGRGGGGGASGGGLVQHGAGMSRAVGDLGPI